MKMSELYSMRFQLTRMHATQTSERRSEEYPISRAESDMSSGADKFAQLIFRRLSPDRPASSFTTQFRPDGFQGRVVHPNEARVCTPAEALSCLGFEVPVFRMPSWVGHRLAGNAFSPLVAKAILMQSVPL